MENTQPPQQNVSKDSKCPLFNDECPYFVKQRKDCPYLNPDKLDKFEKTGKKCPFLSKECPYLNKEKDKCPYFNNEKN